jgi:hypothetical protein
MQMPLSSKVSGACGASLLSEYDEECPDKNGDVLNLPAQPEIHLNLSTFESYRKSRGELINKIRSAPRNDYRTVDVWVDLPLGFSSQLTSPSSTAHLFIG